MLARVLLFTLVCWFAWAIADRTVGSCTQGAAAGVVSSHQTDTAGTPGAPERHWHAEAPPGAATTESIWRSQLHHAELASAPCPERFHLLHRGEPSRLTDVPRRAGDIPLLI